MSNNDRTNDLPNHGRNIRPHGVDIGSGEKMEQHGREFDGVVSNIHDYDVAGYSASRGSETILKRWHNLTPLIIDEERIALQAYFAVKDIRC
jgi:hypothetical protein